MNINKFFNLALIVCLLFSMTSCVLFRNPINSWFKAENNVTNQVQKVEQVQQKIQTTDTNLNNEGKEYVYGTHLALQLAPSNPPTQLATQFNDKSIAILGLPDIKTIDTLQQTVNNLLSTNQQLVIKGEKQFADMDAQVTALQSDKTNLLSQLDTAKSKLQTAEDKLIKVGTSNSGLAQKWSDLVKWFWWIVIGIVAIIVIRIVAAVLPPPYNSAAAIVAAPFTLIVKGIEAFIPEALAGAGWVEEEYKTATQDLVNVIEGLKTTNPALHPTISAAVASTVSDSAVAVINTAKTSQQIVS